MILILGAGPAGLAAAGELRRPFEILETEAEPGGLCRSFSLGGGTFDIGGHAFFTRDAEVMALLESHATAPLFAQPRSAWIWSHGVFLPYPFQANLNRLPKEVIEDCLVGLLDRGSGAPAGDLDNWLLQTFGRGVYDHFLAPYNRKVWAFPLDSILPQWVGERIVQPDLRAIVRGALQDTAFNDFPNAHVRYPAKGGFFELFRPLYERVAQHTRLGEGAVELDLGKRRVTTAAGRTLAYENLISTVPLPELCAMTRDLPTHLRDSAAALDHNSLTLVSLSSHRAENAGRHRVYCADPEIYFHKLVFNETSSPQLMASGVNSLQAEISSSAHRQIDPDAVLENTIGALKRMGILRSAADVDAAEVRQVKYGYPVYTWRALSAAQALCDHFEHHGVLSIGRFGEWIYVNSDGALRRGMDAARHLEAGGSGRLSRLHRPAKRPQAERSLAPVV